MQRVKFRIEFVANKSPRVHYLRVKIFFTSLLTWLSGLLLFGNFNWGWENFFSWESWQPVGTSVMRRMIPVRTSVMRRMKALSQLNMSCTLAQANALLYAHHHATVRPFKDLDLFVKSGRKDLDPSLLGLNFNTKLTKNFTSIFLYLFCLQKSVYFIKSKYN